VADHKISGMTGQQVVFAIPLVQNLCVDQLLLGVSTLWLLLQGVLAVQGVDGAVSSLLARHEHGSEGGSHTGGTVQLSHL